VASHLTEEVTFPGQKREHETDDINETNEKMGIFVCFVFSPASDNTQDCPCAGIPQNIFPLA
jgi:hypothetical protein